ncbi:hypothetical protein Tco_1417803 [Tanacetum coccineum]
MGVRVNFTSQSTTAALSIEIGLLFEGESESEKLKIYLITLVSIRSDWEDLPWLFRSVENLNTMADQNVLAQAPTRTDEQIISVDILRNTNFFRAFSASASVPAVYIQQFWNSMKYDEKTGIYCCQIDEQWFNLSADLLRKALDITPLDPTHPFELPSTGDTVIDFVNQLGTVMGRVYSRDSDIPILIPYGRFTKMIIYYMGSSSDVHKRPESPCHLPGDDFLLGNLKFISKGETNEVFRMAIPKQLITQAIQQSLYYPKYLEIVAKNTKKTPQDSASKQPEPATKRAPPKKPTTTTPIKPNKPPSSKQPKSPTKNLLSVSFHKKLEKESLLSNLLMKMIKLNKNLFLKEKVMILLSNWPRRSVWMHIKKREKAPVGGVVIRDPVSETTPKLPEVVGKGKAIITEEQVAHSLIDLSKKKRTTYQFILVRRDQAPHDSTTGPSSQPEDDTSEKVVYESSSTTDSERTESGTEAAAPKGDKEQGEVASSTVTSGVWISVHTEDQAGSDPRKAHEALAGPDPEPMQEDQTGSDSGKVHVSLAGPNPGHMDEEFLAIAYPKVHENLKLITDEHVIKDNPESHSGSMSSMKNLEDTDNFRDQFLYDKPTEDDQEKSKVVNESDSTIPDPSHQTVMSIPPVIAPFIDFSSPKPSSQVTTPPINTKATSITITLPEITPFIALQLRVAKLEQDMSEVKKTDHFAAILASIKSQVPTIVDKYLGTKLDDALLREQGEKKQESTYTIRSTDKVALEEFDLKNSLFKHMNKNRTANRNPANYHRRTGQGTVSGRQFLWGVGLPKGNGGVQRFPRAGRRLALECKGRRELDCKTHPSSRDESRPYMFQGLGCSPIKAVRELGSEHRETVRSISGVGVRALRGPFPSTRGPGRTHLWCTSYRAHDEDAMDKEVKDRVKDHKRKHDSDDEEDDDDDEGPSAGSNQGKSTKKRRHDSGASGSAQPPPKDDDQSSNKPQDSDASASKPESEPSSDHVSKKDEGHVVKAERPATPEPEWTIPPNDFPKPENNWANAYATTYQVPAENKLQRKTYDIERKTALSISKLKAARYLDFGLEELVPSLWVESERDYDISAAYEDYTIVPKPRAVIYIDRNDQRKLTRFVNEIHKFSDGTLTRVMEKLDHMVKDFHLFEYNKGMETRKWSEDDKRRSKDFITAIDTYPILLSFTHCGVKSILRFLRIILVILPEHPSETKVFHNEDGNPARANIKQALVVMSSASSAVTYTSVYTNSEPGRVFWGADEEISDGGIPRVIVLGYDGLPMQSVALPLPNYVPCLEDLQTLPVPQDEDEREPMFVQAHDPDYVPEPIYPEHIPLKDEHEFPTEEQPLPLVDSPTAELPGYVTELDPEEDPGDDEDEEEEEEEHLALADSAVVVPADEHVSPPEGTEPAEVERLLAVTTPLPSPHISLSPPYAGERLTRCTAPPAHSSPPHVPSPLLPSSGCPTQIQTFRIASTQALIDAVTAVLPSPPLPPLPSSLYISPPIDHRDDIPESEQLPHKRLCLSTLGFRYEIGESSTARPTRDRGVDYGFVSTVEAEVRRQGISEVGYGIRDTWIDPAEAIPEVVPMTVREVNTRVTELAELHERDTQDLYALLKDAQDGRTRISQRVAIDSQRVDLLMGDKMTLQEIVWIMEEETYASREA